MLVVQRSKKIYIDERSENTDGKTEDEVNTREKRVTPTGRNANGPRRAALFFELVREKVACQSEKIRYEAKKEKYKYGKKGRVEKLKERRTSKCIRKKRNIIGQ